MILSCSSSEGAEIAAIARESPIRLPVLAVGAGGGTFTSGTMSQVTEGEVRSVQLDGVGHYAAMEAPGPLNAAILDFVADCDLDRHRS